MDVEFILKSEIDAEVRKRLQNMFISKSAHIPQLQKLLSRVLTSEPEQQAKFILDSCTNPDVISLCQTYGHFVTELVLYLTRTWAYYIHREKKILTGKCPELNSNRTKSDNYTGVIFFPTPSNTDHSNAFNFSGDVATTPTTYISSYPLLAAVQHNTNIIRDPITISLSGPDHLNSFGLPSIGPGVLATGKGSGEALLHLLDG